MPDPQTAFPRKGGKTRGMAKSSSKRKSGEFKDSKDTISSVSTQRKVPKKRKLDQIQHVPTLVSSTFNPLEEVSFPRGGSALTPLERKQAENEGMQDALFEVAEEEDTGRKTKKGTKLMRSRESEMEALLQYHGPRIEGLSFKSLVEETMVLGQVSQINPQDIAIALPNNLTGFVSLTRISPPLTKLVESLVNDDEEKDDDADVPSLDSLFTIGQWLRTVVIENTTHTEISDKTKKKHIELSVEPELVNAGVHLDDILPKTLLQVSVSSVEDHGIIVSLGLDKVSGFIKNSALGSYKVENIHVGQVFLAVVEHRPKNKVAQLSLDLESSSTPIGDVSDITSLLPGDTVQCLLSEVRSAGAGGKVLGMLDATIDKLHTGAVSIDENQTITARISAVFPSAEPRKVALSMLPHVLALDTPKTGSGQYPLDALPMGFIVEAAKVTQVVDKQGVYVDIGIDGVIGFVHISKLSDDRVDSIDETSGPFKKSSLHRARIVGYNPVDNLFQLSFKQQVLEQPFLRLEDVEIASALEGTVERLLEKGIIVKLAEGITGWIAMEQSSDALPSASKKAFGKQLIVWEKRFKEGSTVKVRVLKVDLAQRRIFLTSKKTLVKSSLPPLTSYSPSVLGNAFHGTIVSLTPHGALVEFYAGVKGYLPVGEMSEAWISDATEHFRQGQTVKAWILSVDESEKRMHLSLKDQSYWITGGETAFEALENGSLVEAVVSAKLGDKISIEIPRQEVSLRGVVHLDHLADTPGSKCEKKLAKLREGAKLKQVLVLSKSLQNRVVTCSLKPALVDAASEGHFPSKYEELYRGRKVTGWVKNIEDFGAFIGFAGGVEGVVNKNEMADEPVQDPRTVVKKNQVVTATVVSVDNTLQRSRLTLKSQSSDAVESGEQTEAINPIDADIKFIEDYTPGRLTTAKIVAIKQTQANVALAENLQGRIDVSEIVDSVSSDDELPLRSLRNGALLQVRILGFHDAKTHRYLPITHRTSNTRTTLELSCKPSHIEKNPLPTPSIENIQIGVKYPAFVNQYSGEYLWLNITPTIRGRMHILNLTDRIERLHSLSSSYPLGSALSVTVLGKTDDGKYLNFSCRKNPIRSMDDVSVGSILPGRVAKVTDSGLLVQISENVFGKVGLTDISDTYSAKMTESHRENSIVRVCVLNVDVPNKRISLSMRVSRTLNSSAKQTDREISSIADVKVGEILRGFVKLVADTGLFVWLSGTVVGRVMIRDLSDQFLKDWKSQFKINQLVKGKVVSVDADSNKVGLSLRPSAVGDKAAGKGIDEIWEGERVNGVVSRVEDYGLFIRLDGYSLSGLCHKSEISDSPLEDFQKLYDEGDKVRTYVIKVDKEKKRVSLSLKASYFEDDDEEMPDAKEDESSNEAGDIIETDTEAQDDQMQIDSYVPTPVESQAEPLAVEAFNWTGETVLDDEEKMPDASDSESDINADEAPKPRKHKRSEIKFDKTQALPLASSTDFERVLLSQPDSSQLWTQYMAHLLQLGQIDQARTVADRALKTINMREEAEKMNIWVALLNMENSFGTEDTLDAAFHRACEYTDKKKMHTHMARILTTSGKDDKADETYQAMLKKFHQSCKVWVNYASFLIDHERQEEARELLQRSLRVLAKRKHVKTVSRFAQLEFKSEAGSPEHGRTIMTGLLANYPRRFDIWSIFLDLEIKQNDVAVIRLLFERVLALKMSMKKAKFFFKKWLQWETEHGDAEGADDVRRRAKQYVESHSAE